MIEIADKQEVLTLEVADGIAFVAIDSPPVNALGHAVRDGLDRGLRQSIDDPSVDSIVIYCKGRTFFAGADISEFGKERKRPSLDDLIALIEASPKLVIAAIHGTALGGGLEVALGCHYRIAVPTAKVGLPEVALGILPGAGGTQRAPRLVGIKRALELIVGGKPIGATQALEAGLIDELVGGDLKQGAAVYAQRLVTTGAPLRRVRDLPPDLDPQAAADAIAIYRKENARAFKGVIAPDRIVQAIEAAATLPFDDGIRRERELFLELVASPESAAQRYFFFAERAAGKVPGLSNSASPSEIRTVTVIGAGTMGSGIATAFLNKGLPVTLVDRDAAAVDRGVAAIGKTFAGMLKKGRITEAAAEQRTRALTASTDIASAAVQADLIVEAVYENLDLKQNVFQQLDAAAKPDAILATNTSFLDVNAIAAVTKRAKSVVGLHFFAPANVMRLLEVVRGAETSDTVISTAMALGPKLGKIAILSGVCDGFIANRVMKRRTRAAEALILEGPLPWAVDRAMVNFGFAMGPFAMLDLVGLDVIGWDRENSAGRTVQEVLCEMDRWGQKKGGGYYDYDADRRGTPSDVAARVIRDFAAKSGIEQRAYGDEEIVGRLLYPVVNEGAKVIEEGIALRASDVDVALITGYGWPVWTGGPMFWADHLGLDRVVAVLDRTGTETVSPLLRTLAATGGRFTE